jgi:serine/threonine protein kinase
MLRPEIYLQSAAKEYKVMMQAKQEKCCHLVWLAGLGLGVQRNQVCIITGDAGGSLSTRFKDVEDPCKPSSLKQHGRQLNICFQLLLAVQELLALGLHHLDINPSNITLRNITAGGHTQYYLRLLDFGISKEVGSEKGTKVLTQKLTGEYYAPELIGRAVRVGSLALEAADVWSIGSSMMYIQTGEGQVQVPGSSCNVLRQVQLIVPDGCVRSAWCVAIMCVCLESKVQVLPSARQHMCFGRS